MIILQITEEKKEKICDLVEGIKAMAMRLDECWDGLEWRSPEGDTSARTRYEESMTAPAERHYERDHRYEERMGDHSDSERRVYRSGEGYVDGYRQRY